MNAVLRVLVVDDSPVNRHRITEIIESSGVGRVVAVARDGAEALARVQQFAPDVVTLDLEMPRMDGFSFLRVLMTVAPTPVVVVSSYSQKENVFRALELGAVDFVPKGTTGFDTHTRELLVEKLTLVTSVRAQHLSSVPKSRPERADKTTSLALDRKAPPFVVAIGASTGGPTALTEILANLQPNPSYAVLVAQHMPAKFTRTFAQRLNRYSLLDVQEAQHEQLLLPGAALVCPGDSCMELRRTVHGSLSVRLTPPTEEERYVPNVTRLFRSVAAVMGKESLAVVLTGMGDDGALGAVEIEGAGGLVLTENEASAVVYGMPRAASLAAPSAIEAGLAEMATKIQRLVRERTGV